MCVCVCVCIYIYIYIYIAKKKFFLVKIKTFISHKTSILSEDFFPFSFSFIYSNIVKVFDKMGYAWNLCFHRSNIHISISPFHFPSIFLS